MQDDAYGIFLVHYTRSCCGCNTGCFDFDCAGDAGQGDLKAVFVFDRDAGDKLGGDGSLAEIPGATHVL